MPRKINIAKKTTDAIYRYIDIRYSHWTENERAIFRGRVGRELERRNGDPEFSGDAEKEYRDKVKAFFERNQDFLDMHNKSSEQILADQKKAEYHQKKLDKLFAMTDAARNKLVRKYKGDTAAIFSEV